MIRAVSILLNIVRASADMVWHRTLQLFMHVVQGTNMRFTFDFGVIKAKKHILLPGKNND